MTTDAFDIVLDELMDRKPFRVFTVVLKDGSRFEIDHPRATVLRDGIAIFLSPGGRPVWFDADSVLNIAGSPASELSPPRNDS